MIAAVMLVRDEADVIGYTLSHLFAHGVDFAIVSDNRSDDDTRAILESFPQVTVIDDDEPGHYQGRKTTAMARQAFDQGAEWVLPCDADELFYPQTGTLAEFFAGCPLGTVTANVWDHVATDFDDCTANPYTRIAMRRQYPQRLPKVAFRAGPDALVEEGNHGVAGVPGERGPGLYARHFQYRSYEQMVRKVRNGAAALDAAGMHPLHGTHWRDAARLADDALFSQWRRLCEESGLIEDPAPYRGDR